MEEDTYYGFMIGLCLWTLMDPNVVATVQQVHTLLNSGSNVAVTSQWTYNYIFDIGLAIAATTILRPPPIA